MFIVLTTGMIAIALGALSNFILYNAVSILSQDSSDGFYDLAAIIMMFLHLLILLVSFPILMNALPEAQPGIRIVIGVEAILNSLFMMGIIYFLPAAPVGYLILIIILFLDFVPLFMVKTIS